MQVTGSGGVLKSQGEEDHTPQATKVVNLVKIGDPKLPVGHKANDLQDFQELPGDNGDNEVEEGDPKEQRVVNPEVNFQLVLLSRLDLGNQSLVNFPALAQIADGVEGENEWVRPASKRNPGRGREKSLQGPANFLPHSHLKDSPPQQGVRVDNLNVPPPILQGFFRRKVIVKDSKVLHSPLIGGLRRRNRG